MNRIFLVLVIAAAALAMGMGMGVVGAQEQANESNETANATANESYELAFNENLRVLDYELEDGTATITFDADLGRTIEVTDAMDGIGESGIVEPYSREYEIDRGETTITMDVTQVRGASSVSVTAAGKTARFSSDFDQEPHDPLQYFGGISGLFTGIGLTVVIFGGAAWYVVRKEDSGVIEA